MSNQRLVGQEGYSIAKIIQTLRSTPSFFLFDEKWTAVARGLQVPPGTIKEVRCNSLLDKISLVDTVKIILENWTSMNPADATIDVLITELDNNGLRDCAESLQAEFLRDSLNKYKCLPSDLSEFLLKSSKPMCIISTVDCSITYEKIREHERLSIRQILGNIIQAISTNSIDNSHLQVVIDCDMGEVTKLIFNVLGHQRIDFPRIAVVTTENDADLQKFVNNYPYLRNKIHICRDTLKWDDLTSSHQRRLMRLLREKFGTRNAPFEYHDKLFSEQQLAGFIHGDFPKLFVNTIPALPSYYVSRKIMSRQLISTELLDKDYQDIFLIKGLERLQLSSLVRNRITDCSSSQILLRKASVKFITVDSDSHFEDICQINQVPVHQLRYVGELRRGKLIWEKSYGEVSSLHKHIHKTLYATNVNMLVENLSTSMNSPICISGCPGMGKTTLLGEIGNCLSTTYPERAVIFVKASDFINKYKGLVKSDWRKSFESATQELIWKNELERSWLMYNLDSDSVKVELLLSRFDDIPPADLELGLEVLNEYKSYKFIRLWLTTRPCALEEIENKLSVLAHIIAPFNDEDQIIFLMGYWNQGVKLNQPQLREFSDACLSALKAKLKSASDDISGIPFHCQAFAELLNQDVEDFAQLGGDLITPLFSISDLYQGLIEKRLAPRIRKNATLNRDELLNIHLQLSMALLFPELSKRPEEFFYSIPAAYSYETLQIGIVECKNPLQFIHNSFASYFVAWGLANEFANQPLGELIAKISSMISPDRQPHLVFEFLDSLLEKRAEPKKLQTNGRVLRGSNAAMKKIAHLCVSQNFSNIFSKFNSVSAFGNQSKSIFTRDLILSAFQLSSVHLIKEAFLHFEQHHNFDVDMQKEALQYSVRRGNFPIVEYLLDKIRNNSTIFSASIFGNTLGECIRNSKQNSKFQVVERVTIMRTLLSLNPSIIEFKDENGNTPLLTPSAHVLLLIELLQMGGNPLAQNKFQDTVLHPSDAEHGLTGEEYSIVMLNIRDNDLQSLVHLKGNNDDTPLLRLIKISEPNPETIKIFKLALADFNCTDKHGLSVLANAIIGQRNSTTIDLLITNGASIQWRGLKGESLLHIAAKMGQIDSIHLLLSLGVNVNERDRDGNTPLHSAMERVQDGNFEIVKLLLEDGANPNITNGQKKVPLNVENERLNPETLKLLKTMTNIQSAGNREGIKTKRRWMESNSPGNSSFGTSSNNQEPMQLDLDSNTERLLSLTNFSQEVLLHKAALSTDKVYSLDFIKFLISSGADVYSKDTLNYTFLHRFIEGGKPTASQFHLITEYLLAENLSPIFNIHGGENLATPLHLAAKVIEPEVQTLRLLLSNGANFNPLDKHGDSILSYAVKGCRSVEFLSELISYGVDYTYLNNHRHNLLHQAAAFGTASALAYLLDLGGLDINAMDMLGNTPLHHALQLTSDADLLKKCKMLIDMGADVNIRNEGGSTPMAIIDSLDKYNVKNELLALLKR